MVLRDAKPRSGDDRAGGAPTPLPASLEFQRRRPPAVLWIITVLLCVGVVSYPARHFVLFADDYVFLVQAKEKKFDLAYLRLDLFQHFSPISRAVNYVLEPVLPQHHWAPFAALILMVAAVVLSAMFVMVALFGRTYFGLLGSALLGSSLSLVPTMHWWTAGLNILPAMAGALACFGAMVRLLRGGNRWWGALAIAAYGVGVLDYELAMLTPGYVFVWLILCQRRTAQESAWATLRRTLWAWVGLGVVLVASAVNYRLNYYAPAPHAPLRLIVKGLYFSLFHGLLPNLIGIHANPGTTWDRVAVIAGGIVAAALFVTTVALDRRALRGWVLAGIGWLLPMLALLVNRLGYSHNPEVGTNLVYLYFSTAIFIIGAMDAVAVSGLPRRLARLPTTSRRSAVQTTVVAFVAITIGASWAHSIGPALSPQAGAAPARAFIKNVEAGARVAKARGPYSVLNDAVPEALVTSLFAPYNRASRVVGLTDPDIPFDSVDGALYKLDETGKFRLASYTPLTHAAATDSDAVVPVRATDVTVDPVRGQCFRAGPTTEVHVKLPHPVTAKRLVVRSNFSVSAQTTETTYVSAGGSAALSIANYDSQTWGPHLTGRLDTTSESTIGSVVLSTFTPGVNVCISSVEVGSV